MTDPRGVCARRAEDLAPEVPYVRGWAAAKRGAEALAEKLRAVGLESDFPGLRADVNVVGEGMVSLGEVRPEAVQYLVGMLVTGLALEMAEQVGASADGERPRVPRQPGAEG